MDRKGVMGLPMRLVITFLILSMFVPAAVYMVDDLQDDAKISVAKKEAEKISDAISKVYYSGAGASAVVDVSVGGGCGIVMGGNGSDAYILRILCDGEEKDRIHLQRPSVRVMNSLEIYNDSALLVTCVLRDGVYGVEVERS